MPYDLPDVRSGRTLDRDPTPASCLRDLGTDSSILQQSGYRSLTPLTWTLSPPGLTTGRLKGRRRDAVVQQFVLVLLGFPAFHVSTLFPGDRLFVGREPRHASEIW